MHHVRDVLRDARAKRWLERGPPGRRRWPSASGPLARQKALFNRTAADAIVDYHPAHSETSRRGVGRGALFENPIYRFL
jgi:hypothetical protein